MFARLAIIAAVAFAVYVGLRVLLRKKSLNVGQFFRIYIAALVGLALLYMGVTGRLHPLFALLGVVLPFLARIASWVPRGFQFFSLFHQLRGSIPGASAANTAGQGQTSEINTRFLHMVLFHDTGMMDGEVLEGAQTGEKLTTMALSALLSLHEECRPDPDSVSVLEAFLDREHASWRDQTDASSGPPPHAADGAMDERQAFEILGLAPEASRDDVVQAHRRLMQKLHPDRGGSTYLAARINEAKTLLLNKIGKA